MSVSRSPGLGCTCALILAAALPAQGGELWSFDLATSGEDVFWTSPTAVNPNAVSYDAEWNIERVEATVKYSIFPQFTVDVTSYIPPEYLSGIEKVAGPAPLIIHDDRIVFPEPPEPPSVAADVKIELNAAGFGVLSLTNVFLGEIEVNVPPFGNVIVQILKIRTVGTVEVEAYVYPIGDLNCDGEVDFGDINPFILALSNPAGYMAQFPDCDIKNGDINQDGKVDFGDINPFVTLLTNP